MVRVVATADWHVRDSLSWRGKDILANIDRVIEFSRDCKPDLILHGGDLFASRSPPITDRREVAARLKALSEIAPTVVALGNHDMTARSTVVDDIVELRAPWLYIPRQPRVVQFKTANVLVFPWLFPEKIEIERSHSTRQEKALAIANLLDSAISAIVTKMTKDRANILVAHATAFNAKYGEHRDVVLGSDIIWRNSWWEPFDFVCLGHIHKPQQIQENVVYPGSPERMTFGERDEDKGFYTWDGTVEFHNLPTRPMFFFEGGPEALASQLDKTPDGARVKARVELEHGQTFSYRGDRFAMFEVEKRYPRKERRYTDMPNLNAKDFHEVMTIWWRSQGKTDEEIADYFEITERLEENHNADMS